MLHAHKARLVSVTGCFASRDPSVAKRLHAHWHAEVLRTYVLDGESNGRDAHFDLYFFYANQRSLAACLVRNHAWFQTDRNTLLLARGIDSKVVSAKALS